MMPRAEKLFPLRIGSFFRTAIPNPPTFAPASVHGKMQKSALQKDGLLPFWRASLHV
jgi:hypothetical protein